MFPRMSGSEGSKGFHAIWSCCSREPMVPPDAPSFTGEEPRMNFGFTWDAFSEGRSVRGNRRFPGTRE